MTKWEYKIVEHDNARDFLALLNREGLEGWQFCHAAPLTTIGLGVYDNESWSEKFSVLFQRELEV